MNPKITRRQLRKSSRYPTGDQDNHTRVTKQSLTQLREPLRRSARLEAAVHIAGVQATSRKDASGSTREPATSNAILYRGIGGEPPSVPQRCDLKKRKHEEEADAGIGAKRPRNTPTGLEGRTEAPQKETIATTKEREPGTSRRDKSASISYWTQDFHWPQEYFRKDGIMAYPHPVARSFLRRKSSTPSVTTASDQKPREVKSSQYLDVRYEALLAARGVYLDDAECGVSPASKAFCRSLLEKKQIHPPNSLFKDDIFLETVKSTRSRNEARVIKDITPLLVASAESLAIMGVIELKVLIENVNEGWNNSIPFTNPRPQPDYSVGFRSSAFSKEQLKKLEPLIGGLDYSSYFMATYQCYFPFLTCEVKCGAGALDVADRQNAHSMTLAVRGVVELYRCVKREKELHREILAFSVSHDQRTVRIYGHYALIDGDETSFYRHPIREINFTEQDGREKWTTHGFTMNIYDVWMPSHLKRICSAIDDLPSDLSLELSQQLEGQSRGDAPLTQQESSDSFSAADEESQRLFGSREVTPPTSATQDAQPAFKKPRKRA